MWGCWEAEQVAVATATPPSIPSQQMAHPGAAAGSGEPVPANAQHSYTPQLLLLTRGLEIDA